jgi:hypothetical protein
MPDLPDTQTLDRLAQNPSWLIPIALFFTAWLIISNWDKLAGSFGKKRRWEAEKARLEVNQKYWELQTYKKHNKFDDKDDPFPAGALILGNGKGEVRQVEDFSFGRRVLFGSLGGYIGFASLFILALSSRSQSTPSSFDGMIVAMVILGGLAGLITAAQKRNPNQPLKLIAIGVVHTLTVTFFGGLLTLLIMLST